MWNDVLHKIRQIVDFRRGASHGSQSQIVVRTRGERTSQWTSSWCTAMICSLIGSVLISTPLTIGWSQIHLLIFVQCDTHTHTDTRVLPAVTLGRTVSESFSRLIINNAWLWEDERLFWLKACFSYGETRAVAVLTVRSYTKWVFLLMSTPNWSSGIKCELIWREWFEK